MPKLSEISHHITAYTLERPVHFLREHRTELYKKYCSGGAHMKNVLGAKSSLQSWTLFNLGRNGV